jgi:DNA repair exonuclease SbcCD nuclease subunit
MLIIAGNHDDPLRLDARSLLTKFVNVQIVGRPRPAYQGGTRTLETRGGETAVIAALPFVSPGAWVSALDIAGLRTMPDPSSRWTSARLERKKSLSSSRRRLASPEETASTLSRFSRRARPQRKA